MSEIAIPANWKEFIDKLTIIKSDGLVDRISVPAMVVLLYNGAFDDLLTVELSNKHIIQVYKNCFQDIIQATKSKAGLPKKGKNIIGISDITTEAHLAMWRQINSPIGVYPFIDSLKENLGLLGYTKDHRTKSYKKTTDKATYVTTDNWSNVIQHKGGQVWKQIMDRHIKINLIGILTKYELKKVSGGTKEMAKVSIFTGRENVDELIIWPDWGETEVSPYYKSILEVGQIFMMEVYPRISESRVSGSVSNVKKFQN